MSLIWMKPVTGPKAWRGEQLAYNGSWIMTLTAEEIADLDRALTTAKAAGSAASSARSRYTTRFSPTTPSI